LARATNRLTTAFDQSYSTNVVAAALKAALAALASTQAGAANDRPRH